MSCVLTNSIVVLTHNIAVLTRSILEMTDNVVVLTDSMIALTGRARSGAGKSCVISNILTEVSLHLKLCSANL